MNASVFSRVERTELPCADINFLFERVELAFNHRTTPEMQQGWWNGRVMRFFR